MSRGKISFHKKPAGKFTPGPEGHQQYREPKEVVVTGQRPGIGSAQGAPVEHLRSSLKKVTKYREPIGSAQGAPVEVTADPMYTRNVTRTTGESYDPLSGTSIQPQSPGMQAKVTSPGGQPVDFTSGARDAQGRTYRQRERDASQHLRSSGKKVTKSAVRSIATHGVPVQETHRQAVGTGIDPKPEVMVSRTPPGATGSMVGSADIPTRVADRFDIQHGATPQQQLAAEREIEARRNLAPRSGGR